MAMAARLTRSAGAPTLAASWSTLLQAVEGAGWGGGGGGPGRRSRAGPPREHSGQVPPAQARA